MDKYKKWILIIIGLIIVLIVAIFTLYQYSTKEKQPGEEIIDNLIEGDTNIVVNEKVKVLDNRNLYYTIQNVIKNYQVYVSENNQVAINAVNFNNMNSLKAVNIQIKQIYYKEEISYGNCYISAIDQENKEIYFAVYLDNVNSTYLIENLDKSTFESIIQGTTQKIRKEMIEVNEYNRYQYVQISDEKMIDMYIKDFIEKARNNPTLAYELLDKEYKQKKFGNIENFTRYIKNNVEKIENGSLTNYGTNKTEKYTQYYYKNTNGYFITIKETSIMNYTIKLDDYTIKDTDYIEKYNQLTQEEKVNNNISIFIRMLNEKEYQTAYYLLDETFRNNQFKTVAEFEKYAGQNFWNYNIGTITKIEKQGDLYLCTYKIKSGVGLSAEETIKTFVMQLKEGTDFVMSFGV